MSAGIVVEAAIHPTGRGVDSYVQSSASGDLLPP